MSPFFYKGRKWWVDGPKWPRPQPSAYQPVSDLTMLAAVERTGRLQRRPNKKEIARHLGFGFSGAMSRSLEGQLRRLRGEGWVEVRPVRHGFKPSWHLTDAGREYLDGRREEVRALPESPEHRQWRICHGLADERIGEFRDAASEALRSVHTALDAGADGEVDAARIVELVRLLRWRMTSLGVALYCLNDWAEPDDDTPDPHPHPFSVLDPYRRHLELLNGDEDDASHYARRYYVGRVETV